MAASEAILEMTRNGECQIMLPLRNRGGRLTQINITCQCFGNSGLKILNAKDGDSRDRQIGVPQGIDLDEIGKSPNFYPWLVSQLFSMCSSMGGYA